MPFWELKDLMCSSLTSQKNWVLVNVDPSSALLDGVPLSVILWETWWETEGKDNEMQILVCLLLLAGKINFSFALISHGPPLWELLETFIYVVACSSPVGLQLHGIILCQWRKEVGWAVQKPKSLFYNKTSWNDMLNSKYIWTINGCVALLSVFSAH